MGPFHLKIRQGFLGFDIIGGLINPLQILGDILTILPPTEVQGVAHQMHDARLDSRLGEGRVDRIRKAFETIHYGDQDVFDAAIAQVVHHREPELGPFVVGNPQA